MATGWKITRAARAKLAWVARLRKQDPGDDALAEELGISRRAVQYHLQQERLRNGETYFRQDVVIPRAWLSHTQHEPDRVDSPASSETQAA